jgi:hypothetical protein
MAELKLDRDDVNTITGEDGTVWVEIASCGTQDEANLLQGFLQSEGIPAQIESVKFDEIPTNFGAMGEIRIYVAEEDEERALQLLKQREDEYQTLDDDDETLVTDDGVAKVDENARADDDGSDS